MAIEELTALTVIDCSTAGVTLSATALEVTPFWVAVMLVEPMPMAVASPVALIVAAAAFDDVQLTELVRFCVLPSLKIPVAVNWLVVPLAIEFAGAVMLIDCRVAAVIVSTIAFEVMPFVVAVMLLDPVDIPVARPPAVMLAAAVFEEPQATELVKFCVLPSLYVPIAVN